MKVGEVLDRLSVLGIKHLKGELSIQEIQEFGRLGASLLRCSGPSSINDMAVLLDVNERIWNLIDQELAHPCGCPASQAQALNHEERRKLIREANERFPGVKVG